MLARLFEFVKPAFWNDPAVGFGPYKGLFNYRRIWVIAVALLAAVALVPLTFISYMDYNVTRKAVMSENLMLTIRATSNTRRNVTFFMNERRSALQFVAKTIPSSALSVHEKLHKVLNGLKLAFGGFSDLGFIDSEGRQVAYVGPYELEGKNYRATSWFKETMERGSHVSDMFLGYRDAPHFVVAVRFSYGKTFGVLRASIAVERFMQVLSGLDLSGDGDAFVVNHEGVLQLPSRYHGGIFDKMDLKVPEYADRTEALEARGVDGEPLVVGYAYIKDSPFILMVVKKKNILMKPLTAAKNRLLWILGISVAVILIVIGGVATSMVERIHVADQTRANTLRRMEHTNRMASIGRLAAGVAHEINNPLAIINEKAGLMQDLFTFRDEYKGDDRLTGLLNSILRSVERCGAITKRLLSFAREVDMRMETLDLKQVVGDVLGFLEKESEYRNIEVVVESDPQTPEIISDRGKLQQVVLNLVNNAFQAMNDGGRLEIEFGPAGKEAVKVRITDDGCGIPGENLEQIFEPFFSTKKKQGGTGLGLSITYGLIKELGGVMNVESEVGVGTTFMLLLPIKPNEKGGIDQ